MDEHLEHAIEGSGGYAPAEPPVPFMGMQASNQAKPGSWRVAETAVRREEALPFAGSEKTEEKTEETTGQEEGMNPETKPDEAEAATDEGPPDAEAEEPGDAGATEATGGTAEKQPMAGMVVQPPSKKNPPLSGEGNHQNDGGGVLQPNRNIYAEWQELAEAHPEVVGKELPEDIYQACMQSELPPLRVYESMMLQKQSEQIAALQQEIATLRQNAENTARAPVVAAAEGPANEPEDLFIRDLFSY